MRLSRVVEIIETSRPILEKNVSQNGNNYSVNSPVIYLNTIRGLADIEPLRLAANNVINSLPEIKNDSPVYISTGSMSFHNQLIKRMELISQLLKSMNLDTGDNRFFFKLPSHIDIKDVSAIANQLDRCIHQVFNADTVDAKISFSGFDRGSDWIIFLVDSAPSMLAVTAFWAAVAALAKKLYELEKMNQEVESQNLELQEKRQFGELKKRIYSGFIEKEAEDFLKKYAEGEITRETANEHFERVCVQMDRMSRLVYRGAEIEVPKLSSPAEDLRTEETKLLENLVSIPKNKPALLPEPSEDNEQEN